MSGSDPRAADAGDEVQRLAIELHDVAAALPRKLEVRAVFGLTAEELNIDLGPLGRLI